MGSATSPIVSRRIAQSSPEAKSWPTQGWSYLAKENADLYKRFHESAACREFERFWLKDQDSNALRTDQLVVVKNGQIFFEYKDGPYGGDKPHSLWSASKTVTSMLIGAATEKNLLQPQQHLSDFFPRKLRFKIGANEARYDEITIEDLLQMGSGFQWEESYEGSIQTSSVLDMVYLTGWKDMALHALQAPLLPEGPGKRWNYSSGNSNILMGVLKTRLGKQYDLAPWELIFNKLGMRSVRIEQDAAGTYVGSSYVYMNARDLAKLGYLFLNNGKWENQQILPANWTEYSTQVSPPLLRSETPIDYIKEEGVYGRGLWLNKDVRGLGLPFPNAPEDMFFAAGHYGQLLFVIPSLDMVIARTGWDSEYWSKIDPMVKRAVDCFSSPEAQ